MNWKLSKTDIPLNNSELTVPLWTLSNAKLEITFSICPYRMILDVPSYSDNYCKLELGCTTAVSDKFSKHFNKDLTPAGNFTRVFERDDAKLVKFFDELEDLFIDMDKDAQVSLSIEMNGLRRFARLPERNNTSSDESANEKETAKVSGQTSGKHVRFRFSQDQHAAEPQVTEEKLSLQSNTTPVENEGLETSLTSLTNYFA